MFLTCFSGKVCVFFLSLCTFENSIWLTSHRKGRIKLLSKNFSSHIISFVPLASGICFAVEKCEVNLTLIPLYVKLFSLYIFTGIFLTLCIIQGPPVGNKIHPRWIKWIGLFTVMWARLREHTFNLGWWGLQWLAPLRNHHNR